MQQNQRNNVSVSDGRKKCIYKRPAKKTSTTIYTVMSLILSFYRKHRKGGIIFYKSDLNRQIFWLAIVVVSSLLHGWLFSPFASFFFLLFECYCRFACLLSLSLSLFSCRFSLDNEFIFVFEFLFAAYERTRPRTWNLFWICVLAGYKNNKQPNKSCFSMLQIKKEEAEKRDGTNRDKENSK